MDLVVKSMDDSVEVELCKVRGKVIAKGGDLARCPQLIYEH